MPSAADGRRAAPWREGVLWIAVAAIATAALVSGRERIGVAHVALAYLLVVLFASARCGRRVGLVLAGACFVAFNFFFVRPYGTFAVHDPLDWLVLLAFLLTSAVAAQLLHRAQAEARAAEGRARELQRLATLGAEALNAPRAEDAAAAIARVIREEMRTESCELYLRDAATDRLLLVARATAQGGASPGDVPPAERSTAEVVLDADARTLVLPLDVRDRQLGILRLHSTSAIPPEAALHPFAQALGYYAALGLERVRLATAAAHADALREADRLKDAVLSAVSHDLRTPLTAIKAMAHEIADDGDRRGAAVETEADRLNRYVGNLLDLSRLNAGALPVTRELVPVEDLLGAALRQVAPVASGRDVRVELEREPLLVGELDFVLSLRALANVVENALRYSPPDAPVDVRAWRDGARVRIEVADRGPGIALHERERIFEPFQRGSGTRDPAGAGLGLPIARRLVEAQGGAIDVAPRAGGGATFTLSLPAADVGALAEGSL